VAARLLLSVPKSVAQLRAGESCEVSDPGFQRRFVSAAFRDALTAGMRDAQGRLQKQDRLLGILAVDEFHERPAKRVDARGVGILSREMQPCRGGNSFHVVAISATCLFEDRVNLLREGNWLGGKQGRSNGTQNTQSTALPDHG